MPVRKRRTQEERSSATRALLLDATVDCLYRLGYAGTTTTEVVARAGLSRGAQLHHFPTKKLLVTTAVEHLLARRLAEFQRGVAALAPGEDRIRAAVDLLWAAVSGPAFYAWLELVVAARTDPDLRRACADIDRRFAVQVRETFRRLFGLPAGGPPTPIDNAPSFALLFLQGVALERIVNPDDEKTARMLKALRRVARQALAP